MKLEKYLPIGTIVILKQGEKKLMITGFCAMDQEDGTKFDYCGCLYPEGALAVEEVYLFNHEQIEKIFYLGYDDDEEKKFKKNLLEAVSKETE